MYCSKGNYAVELRSGHMNLQIYKKLRDFSAIGRKLLLFFYNKARVVSRSYEEERTG